MLKSTFIQALFVLICFCSCKNEPEVVTKETWVEKPVNDWPELVMTNKVEFTDSTYTNFGNAFLIETGADTFAVTCKHIFMLFRAETNNSINLGSHFKQWQIYPKGKPEKAIHLGELLNGDKNEETGQFNTLKVRDWIIFRTNEKSDFTPLKIRSRPVSNGEVVYALGWAFKQTSENPSLIKMQVFKNMGPYYYTNTLTESVDPAGRSGSPVIDKNGYLVGLVSGAEGKLGVMCGIPYLNEQLAKFQTIKSSK
ncbi:serine protease [uncultured Draconibacterium sp.]|uniref:S1 family peptidase n=1 Tax=uncultured Draconibacterium sp. TaxID=1573823 RepID=UPI002AA8DE5B|nr:serine protease [uncultured Draconibacterium sp.]